MDNKNFKFSDYDCIGFDLDNTLAKFKITAMVEMQYEILSKFLIAKGYPKKYLLKEIDFDFIQKGLLLDTEKGNILKVAGDGKIVRAAHGTKALKSQEINEIYPNGHWALTDAFIKDPLETWNGPKSEQIRSLQDYFDVVVSLLFARLVDTVDEEQKDEPILKYTVYTDILYGLIDMFTVEHFEKNKGGYYPEMKSNPDKFYEKCSQKLLDWLKTLRSKGKLLFLVTGSYIDFATLTASNTLGPNWKDYFDLVITYAKKPGFFNLDRSFIGLDGFKQTDPIPFEQLELGQIYVHGNWRYLHKLAVKHLSKPNPKFLYIGDAVIQDVYTPNIYANCDTVAVTEELDIEKCSCVHPDTKILKSSFWGSYFTDNGQDTVWCNLIKKHAKLCIPNMDFAADMPL